MEKRIELEKRARKPNQITELNLDNCRSTSIVGLTDEYTALESLSLINVGLTTLKGFPKLPNLKKLELSDNRISNGLNYLTTSPKLQYLNLSGNKIKDLDTLKPLEEFKNLAILDLFNNEATQTENYREKIFKMLPSLKFLDGFDCNDDEAPSDGDDDEEVNGNDSDDDAQGNAFCLNGIEIDLDELAELEKRVQAKQLANSSVPLSSSSTDMAKNHQNTSTEPDDLDEYLKELKIKEKSNEVISHISQKIPDSITGKRPTSTTTNDDDVDNTSHSINFAILLYWFLAILNLVNAVHFYSSSSENDIDDNDDDDQDDCENEEDFDDDDNSIVASSERGPYDSESDLNDIDEVNYDWEEEEEDEADEGGDETGVKANNETVTTTTEPKVEADEEADGGGDDEPQARGKKRKHDG